MICILLVGESPVLAVEGAGDSKVRPMKVSKLDFHTHTTEHNLYRYMAFLQSGTYI